MRPNYRGYVISLEELVEELLALGVDHVRRDDKLADGDLGRNLIVDARAITGAVLHHAGTRRSAAIGRHPRTWNPDLRGKTLRRLDRRVAIVHALTLRDAAIRKLGRR